VGDVRLDLGPLEDLATLDTDDLDTGEVIAPVRAPRRGWVSTA
jgi:hypothetical protein